LANLFIERISKVKQHRHYDKAVHWTKLISITGGAQIIVQFISLISGVLIIRELPTQEYALYTLANTVLGMITVLADGGISVGVFSASGKVWQDKDQLGKVINTGLSLRRIFGFLSIVVSIPILSYMLYDHGATFYQCVLIVASLIPAFYAALQDSILEIVPKLHQDIGLLQKNQIFVGVLRLILTCLGVFLFPLTFILILASGLPRILGNIELKKLTLKFADINNSVVDPEVKKEILGVVKRMLPSIVYYTFFSQITIWLASLLGTSSSLAQAGALGRLAMLFTLITVMFSTLILPRYARLPEDKNVLLSRYVIYHAGFLILSGLIVVTTMLFPHEILWVLGSQYQDLSSELVLTISASCLSIISGVSFSLYSSRGWVIKPIYAIPLNLLTLVACIMLLDLSSLKGILTLSVFIGIQNVLLNFFFGLYKIILIKKHV
jgi:O-antigen/teichoic acid export membrane protein